MLSVLWLATQAWAVDGEEAPTAQPAKTTAEYLIDLSGEDHAKRLYAVRVLRGQLHDALRVVEHGNPNGIAYDDARAALVELNARVPDACMAAIRYPNSLGPCADMLAWLEVRDAVGPLKIALAGETRKGVRKHVEAALAALDRLAAPMPPGAAAAPMPAVAPTAPPAPQTP